ncbi:nucleoside 2-deoxyribosyltransferase [Xanthobacter sp. VTT E-85241]|uniref:nucleoside 2-deoxyribosyltransferase n=1 Tax=Roseixanthobacter finlandensis TaxID=3119922 RepID=UPI00372B9E74
MAQPRIYLAGPEVFRPDAIFEGHRLKKLCAAHGLTGIYPLDEPAQDALSIFHGCIGAIDRCSMMVANISPFRGPHMDPGTAFEIGYAIAKGVPVIGWTSCPGEMQQRIEHVIAEGMLWDKAGHQVEEFGLTENLMITVPMIELCDSVEDAIRAAANHLSKGR